MSRTSKATNEPVRRFPEGCKVATVRQREKTKARGPGRPRVILDPTRVALFLGLLKHGYSRTRACRLVKVDYKTFQKNLRENRLFARTLEAIERERIANSEELLRRLAESDEPRRDLRALGAESFRLLQQIDRDFKKRLTLPPGLNREERLRWNSEKIP